MKTKSTLSSLTGFPGFRASNLAASAHNGPYTTAILIDSGRMDISGVKTFRWTAAPGTSGGIGVVTGRHPDPTAKSDIVGVDDYYQQKITAVETLYLIKDAVA